MYEATVTALIVLGVLGLIGVGYWLAAVDLADQKAQVEEEKTILAIRWQALERADRIRAVFLAASRAMHTEAQRRPWLATDAGKEQESEK